jgi:outer membrane protein insertion porin family
VSAINIHGNYAFPSYTLRSVLSLQATNALTFVTSADKYSEYKIEQDRIVLENFYHDNGYPDMRVVDKRIRLTETMRGIIIDIFVEEGEKQNITEIVIDVPIKLELNRYYCPDVPFSWNQRIIDDYESKIRDSLNLAGYVYGEIRQERVIISSGGCKLVYHVYPGTQYRIRDYHIQGNILTNERIIRNFITRPEGTYYSAADLRSLQEGLMRSSIFNDVQINPHAVSAHEVDLHIGLEEAKTKKIFATGAVSNLGYMWNVGFEDRNIFGTGSKTVLKYESDREANTFQFALSNPYITTKNIEAYLNFERVQKSYANDYMFFKQDRNIYSTTVGATWLLKQDLRFGVSSNYFIEKDKNIQEVVDNPGERLWAHYLFGSVKLFRNMLNRYALPDRGYRWELFSQASLPVGDYTYTDSGLSYQHYHPLGKSGFIFYQSISARFMFPYGDTSKSVIPSTRLLTCGGSDDIRGYHYTSVGPEIQSLQTDGTYIYKTVGGNIKSTVKTELILPNSLFKIDYDQIRFSLFMDAAQLWRTVAIPDSYNENGNTYIPAEGVRLTGGLCLRFVSPILPPMTMSLNYPLIQKDRDKIKYEYYSFGSQMEF